VQTHADSSYFGEAMGKLQQCLAKPIEFLQLSQIVPG
jgi:hypothetical protein